MKLFSLNMAVLSLVLATGFAPKALAQVADEVETIVDDGSERQEAPKKEEPKRVINESPSESITATKEAEAWQPSILSNSSKTAPIANKSDKSPLEPFSDNWADKPKESYLLGTIGAGTGQYPFAGALIGHMGRDGVVQALGRMAGYGRDYLVAEGQVNYAGRNFGDEEDIAGGGALLGGKLKIGTSGIGIASAYAGMGGNINFGNICRLGLGPVAAATYANGLGEDRIKTASGEDKPANGHFGKQYDSGKETAAVGAGGALATYCDIGSLQLRLDGMAHSNFLMIDNDKTPTMAAYSADLNAQYTFGNGLIIGATGSMFGSIVDPSKVEADLHGGKMGIERMDATGMLTIGGQFGGDSRAAK